MTSRARHRLKLLTDADVLQVVAATLAACVLSAGGLYLFYLMRVVRIARHAPCVNQYSGCLLLFGKHAPAGQIDGDFEARLARAEHLLRAGSHQDVLLLGGGPADGPTEAEIARRALNARGIGEGVRLRLEGASRDTLQNLRNARDLLHGMPLHTPVTLLSSRYHLARCQAFARQLGLEVEVVAAESRLQWNFTTLRKLTGEAAYVCLNDVGARWARFTRAHRMLARIT